MHICYRFSRSISCMALPQFLQRQNSIRRLLMWAFLCRYLDYLPNRRSAQAVKAPPRGWIGRVLVLGSRNLLVAITTTS